jgi:hypothetical protein
MKMFKITTVNFIAVQEATTETRLLENGGCASRIIKQTF